MTGSSLVASPPVVMAPRTDGVDVVWAVTAPARGWVEWRPVAGGSSAPVRIAGCDRYGFVPQGTATLRVRLAGLAPGSEVELRAVTEATGDQRRHVSDWKRVRTLDPEADSASFVVWNDTHQHAETLALLDERSPRADVWVWNGDLGNNWEDPDEIIPTVLNPAGRDVSDGRPLVLSWGNHDVRGRWAYRLSEVVATADDAPYRALRFGPIAAVVLNTGEDKPDDHPSFGGRVAFAELRQRQAEWLAEQVRQPGFVDAPYRLVVCHIPLRWTEEPVLTAADYAAGEFDHYSRVSRDLWHDSLLAWGAQLVISGHTHAPALIPADAAHPYAQLVGGGPALDEATWISGVADAERLVVTVNRLDGTVAEQVVLSPYR